MFTAPASDTDCAPPNQENEAIQEYVHALLDRQKNLDALEAIQQQIKRVWTVMRKLLEPPIAPGGMTQAVRVARAAQASQAQNSYLMLDRRREENIAALNQAERRASTALQNLVSIRPQPAFPHPPAASETRPAPVKNSIARRRFPFDMA